MHPQQQRWKGFMYALVAAFLWGVSGTCCQFLFEQRGISPEWLVTVRMLSAGLLLLMIGFVKREPCLWNTWREKRDAVQLLIFGVFGMMAVQYTYFITIKHSNAATATVLQYIGPVFITLYLAMRNRRWPRVVEFIAVLLAVVGTFLLVTHGSFNTLSISPLALGLGILAAVALAFYTLQPVQLIHKFKAYIIIGWGMLIGGVVFSFVQHPWDVSGTWDVYAYGATLFIILFATLLAFYLFMTAVRLIGPQTSSLLASAEPLAATVIGVLWLSTPFGWIDWLGTGFILLTIYLLTLSKPATTAH
ncbi:threonine/homoserine efflux transporter RhtA [Chitinophaga skermanii]|uniref:Threonine/homoserine efflux transporter RhtA n=1 Tax=Chitinophaga skermanii TaxID=331697 RepID=A0A327QYF9_9BACT|nr:EamA family transporter [Chitinophaga skermanii]RAJ08754.1 threonine/homoserine efflux transporter RhtA [Chitinophaga skermanii]